MTIFMWVIAITVVKYLAVGAYVLIPDKRYKLLIPCKINDNGNMIPVVNIPSWLWATIIIPFWVFWTIWAIKQI